MDARKVFLLPGEMCAAREPIEIATLLGSCVAVALFNRRSGFGGMNHYMLPRPPSGSLPSGKHGDYSLNILLKMMRSFDETGRLEATVLGGANINESMTIGEGVGAGNIAMAMGFLEKNSIPIVRRDVGGENGRKVYFDSGTGAVEVKRIEKSAHSSFLEERRKALAGRAVRVLIVDDSATVRSILREAMSQDPGIEVVGEAGDPYEARERIVELDPDVLCLDVIMPKLDGITFLKKLFLYKPIPTVIVSTVVQQGSALRQQAERIGAVSVIDKEELELYKGMETVTRILVPKIKIAAATWVRKKTAEELGE